MYIPLHGHSTYSFLEAIGTPKILVKKAKELGFPALALTDIDVMYGIIQLYQAANEAEIKPIFGVEIGFTLDSNNTPNPENTGSICLLAKNTQGYLNLLQLVSFAGEEGIIGRPKIDLSVLEKNKENLILFTGGKDSWIAKMINTSDNLAPIKEIRDTLCKILGKENCYFEVIAQNEAQEPSIKTINQAILKLAKETSTPCIVSNIYSYPSPQDKKTQELAMAIKDNLKLYSPEHRTISTENHLMLEEEIRKICKLNHYSDEQIDEWIANTEKIASACNAKIEMGQALFPKYEAPQELLDLYEKYKDQLICD